MTTFWHNLPKPFFILAPMEAVTDVVFRHVVAAAAPPDVYFTEFTNAASYCSEAGEHSTRGRLAFTADEQPIVAQIWGNNPEHFATMSQGLAASGFAGIDINMGCPDKTVVKNGSCSALIRQPELAAELIAAAKTGGLPVSVKTRLGYSNVDEWHDWLAHLLRQDIANLTIHLRTRSEMSKVPAHYELIPAIKQLRDEIAPQTLLTINGDIRDRAHGEELVREYGIDGIMIGRGVFHNPFAFALPVISASSPLGVTRLSMDAKSQPFVTSCEEISAQAEELSERGSWRSEDCLSEASSAASLETRERDSSRAEAISEEDGKEGLAGSQENIGEKAELIALLNLHLDLFDQYSAELEPRKYEPLKRFFKIYIHSFPGAADLREELMHTKSTDEVRAILAKQGL